MKCPLISMAIRREYGDNPLYGIDCLKEECAWWHAALGDCQLVALAENMAWIAGGLIHQSLDRERSSKLPHR